VDFVDDSNAKANVTGHEDSKPSFVLFKPEDGDDGLQRVNLDLSIFVGQVVLPGDEFKVPEFDVVLGPGLKLTKVEGEKKICVCKAGILARKNRPVTYMVHLKTRNYEKFKKDDIVAINKQKAKGDFFTCEVGTRERANLSRLGFEGATKRFRPDLQVGDCVYGRVIDLPKDYPMEITCVNPSGKSHGLGQLEGGHVFQVPIHFVRTLRTASKNNNLMLKIGKLVPCETAVGANGLIWVKAKNELMTILVAQLIQALTRVNYNQHDELIKKFETALASIA